LAGRSLRESCRPRDYAWNAQTAFQQFRFSAGERPGICETLSAVVAGEDHDRLLSKLIALERAEYAANLLVHGFYHALVGLLRSAVEVEKSCARFGHSRRFRLIARPLPRPVWSIEVQAHQEWLAPSCVRIDDVYGTGAKQFG